MDKRRQLDRLRRFNSWVGDTDPAAAEEIAESRTRPEELTEESFPVDDALDRSIFEESIALRKTRPVIAIKGDEAELVFQHPDDKRLWEDRITRAAPFIKAASLAVGRIDLQHAELDWAGTAWLVHDEIIVTNRHVANIFVQKSGEDAAFKEGIGGTVKAAIDFKQEIGSDERRTFRIVRPLLINVAGPDVAFFQVERSGDNGNLARKLELAKKPRTTTDAAVIGYPAYDSRIPEPDLMKEIFGDVYNKKRLAPGAVTQVGQDRILHNCTTLGGNSGSNLMDLANGEALGLHFSGCFLTTNYAVPSDVVKALLDRASTGAVGYVGSRDRSETNPRKPPRTSSAAANRSRQPALRDADSASIVVPLTVTISVGTPWPPKSTGPVFDAPKMDDDEGEETGEEAAVGDYRGRGGYDPDFLEGSRQIPLPEVVRSAEDILEFDIDGATETELKYEHFSVVMSRSRRMCFFSAANINGNALRKSARVPWKWDPRIPKSRQIMNECYGNPPKFSRGHMTRREDPGWGDARTAKRGNEDSMHVTNTVPQMQAFNSPIWLGLEDYALRHAREDAMKISVFTGPVFTTRDKSRYGVRIPVSFWKIIAFIHDDTGELCATGYLMSQKDELPPEEEFVYGGYTSPQLGVATQVTIGAIERRSGLRFGPLASVDPLTTDEESTEAVPAPLLSFDQIRFV